MCNPYEILGVKETDSYSVIKAGYDRLAKRHHPDSQDQPSERRMVEINEAWSMLKTESARAATDAELTKRRAGQEADKDSARRPHSRKQRDPSSGAKGWGEPTEGVRPPTSNQNSTSQDGITKTYDRVKNNAQTTRVRTTTKTDTRRATSAPPRRPGRTISYGWLGPEPEEEAAWAALFLGVCVFHSWLFTYLKARPLDFAFQLDSDLWPSISAWMPWTNAPIAYAGVAVATLALITSTKMVQPTRLLRVSHYLILGASSLFLAQGVPAIGNIVAYQRTDSEPEWWVVLNFGVFLLGLLVAVGACACARYCYLTLRALLT